MSRANKAVCVMGCLTLLLGLACGICVDLGFIGAAWASGVLAMICLLMAGPAAEVLDCE